MRAHIYLKEKSERTFLCFVELEVVPGGTYIVDNVPYKLLDKPTFVIDKMNASDHKLNYVVLVVEKIPPEEFTAFWLF